MEKFNLGIFAIAVLVSALHTPKCEAVDKGRGGWQKLKDGEVYIQPPGKGWWVKKETVGIPLMLLSPMKKNGRYTLTIVPTLIEDMKFNPKQMKKTMQVYRDGRKSWLANYDGEVLEWLPYKKGHWKNAQEVHEVGYKYRIANVDYVEHSYYVMCKGQFFFMKSLYRDKEWSKDAPKMERMLKNFNCRLRLKK